MHTSPLAPLGTGDAGGMNLVVRELATALAATGIEVELLTRAEGEPRARSVAPGVTLFELEAGPRSPVPKAELPALADEFGEQVALLAGRDSPRYDVIHAHYWLSGLATLPVAIELGIPLVASFHTLAAMKNRHLPPGVPPEPEARLHAERFLATQADAVVAVSAAEVDVLIDELGASADRTWVVSPGVDTAFFTPSRIENDDRLRRDLGLDAGRPILSIVGRVQPLKGHELAVLALVELQSTGAPPPLLVIAGEPSPGDRGFADKLRELATRGGVGGDIRFVGALDRDVLADLLAASTLVLMPSYSETFGIVALESAASGTPVLAYRSTGLLASIREERTGVLLDSRDPAVWAGVIARFLDEGAGPGARRGEGDAVRHAARFAWSASAATLAAVYEGL